MKDFIVIENKIKLPVIVALTKEEQSKGLMNCSWPPPIMAFPSDKPLIKKFWMKNTPSPLDIVFASSGKIIDCFYGEPNSEKEFGPKIASDLVVEFPAGFVKENKILPGQNIKLCFSIKTLAKKFNYNNCRFTKVANIINLDKYSSQISQILNLIRSDESANRYSLYSFDRPRRIGSVIFPFKNKNEELQIKIINDYEQNFKASIKIATTSNEKHELLINKAHFNIIESYNIIKHEITHFIDSLFDPKEHLLFDEDDLKLRPNNFFTDFGKLFILTKSKYGFNGDLIKKISLEEATKKSLLLIVKTNNFKNLLDKYSLKLDKDLFGKLLRFAINLMLSEVYSLMSEKKSYDIGNKIYLNSEKEFKAHLAEILEEIYDPSKNKFYDIFIKGYRNGFLSNKDFDALLNSSKTYKEIFPYLNDENKKRLQKDIAKIVYEDVSEIRFKSEEERQRASTEATELLKEFDELANQWK